MDPSRSSSDAPSCSVSGGPRAPRQANTDGAASQDAAQNDQLAVPQQEHNIFGDMNLNMLMAFMLLLHFMQYAMRPPCGC